jgi:hypothetical protein
MEWDDKMKHSYIIIGAVVVLLVVLYSSDASASWIFGGRDRSKPKPDTQGG